MNSVAAIERDLLVSLRGIEAWRMYRAQPLNPMLVLDVFPVQDLLVNTHRDTIVTVFSACMTLPAFRTAALVRQQLSERVTLAGVGGELDLQRTDSAEWVNLSTLYDTSSRDGNIIKLSKFAGFLVDVGGDEGYICSGKYIRTLAAFWFDLCDAALTAHTVAA